MDCGDCGRLEGLLTKAIQIQIKQNVFIHALILIAVWLLLSGLASYFGLRESESDRL